MHFLSSEKMFKFAYIMKKVIKHKSELFGKELTFTVSEELNKLKGKNLAPKKLAEANEMLRKIKTLPK